MKDFTEGAIISKVFLSPQGQGEKIKTLPSLAERKTLIGGKNGK